MKLFRIVEEGGRGKDYETIKKMAQNINKFEDEDKVQDLEKIKASYVYSGDGRGYTSIFYSSNYDNSSTNRGKSF